MPEDTALPVATLPGGIVGALHSFPHGKILVIGCQNFELAKPVIIKTDKILQDIKKVSNWAYCVFS